jgi:hypothetical protein
MTTQPTNQVMAADAAADTANGITIGVTGQQARWTVAPWGAITPWGQENPVTFEWFIAADDRWHVPAHEPTVRQLRLEGTPVLETRVRIPDGDAVQRIWAVPDGGGSVIIEFENESPKPFRVSSSPRVRSCCRLGIGRLCESRFRSPTLLGIPCR